MSSSSISRIGGPESKNPFLSSFLLDVILRLNVVFFPQLILYFVGSSVESDASGTMKTITYGDKSDSGDDISLLCEELIPTLERLELLSEVCFFYWLQLSSLKTSSHSHLNEICYGPHCGPAIPDAG